MEKQPLEAKKSQTKLVRDRIPEILKSEEKDFSIYFADGLEYEMFLNNKLHEEMEEFIKDQKLEELADILEVIDAICEHKKWSFDQILKIKKKKAMERGSFSKKTICTLVL